MRVLVTGATGFLGGRLSRMLMAEGADVLATGRDRQPGAELAAAGARFVPADLSTTRGHALAELFGPVDAVVHAAALSSAWGRREAFMAANVTATRNLRDFASAAGVKRLVLVSTPAVTFCFADRIGIRENEPLPPPVNAYAETKRIAEEETLADTRLEAMVLRPRAIYGRGDKALLPRLVRAAKFGPLPLLRGGRAVVNLTHVDDSCRAILAALAAPPGLRGVWNISCEEELPVRAIAESAAARSGVAVRWRSVPWPLAREAVRLSEWRALLTPGRPEPPITRYGLGLLAFSQTLDVSAAKRDLGFAAAIGFEEGLRLTFGEGTP
jgi:nucleoside-diphosphate-sugar epimerase